MPSFAQDDLFSVNSETGTILRSRDWSLTKLGPVEEWPQSLRTSVSICLNSAFAILVWWGPEMVMLYNDAYIPVISNKHPQALGAPGKEVFPEIWDTIGPMLEGVMRDGKAVRADDLLLLLERRGYAEECYFTFSYSPIVDETGGVGGVFTPVQETTERVIQERRLQTLSALAEVRAEQAGNAEEACIAISAVLSGNPIDLPFCAIYVFDEQRTRARRNAASPGCNLGVTPEWADEGMEWPPFSAVRNGQIAIVEAERLPSCEIPVGFSGQPTQQLAAMPFKQAGTDRPKGFIIAGANPRKRLDESYISFLSLIANHISGAIADAEALEQERNRAEALAEIDRAKTVFFSNISHEFRTPLTLIMAPLLEELEDAGLSAASRERLEIAQRNSLRLQKLVNNLLDFSRLETGRVGLVFEQVDLVELTEDLVSSFRSAFEKAGLELSVRAVSPVAPVYVDRDLWEKIVLNLLSNAFKFTLAGGVRVELWEVGGSVHLAVEDTGTGIPEFELPRIFERFQRVEGAAGRSFEGSGIGLALVHEMVKLHAGTIAVESTEGSGSRFTVTIPTGSAHLDMNAGAAGAGGPLRRTSLTTTRVEAFVGEALRWIAAEEGTRALTAPLDQDEGSFLPAELTGTGARKRVLLAEDNADMRQYVARLLSDSFEVEAVPDGAQALAAIERQAPDLVLSDVMMPVMDGLTLLTRIRATPLLASLPVILLSARAGEEAHLEGLLAGADDYLIKPFSSRELIARVTSALKVAEIRAESERAIRRSEQELRYTLDLNPQIPWTADRDGNILDCNLRWLELTGGTREEALGTGWINIVHSADREAAEKAWTRAMAEGRPYDLEHRIRSSSKGFRWVRSRAYPRRDESGTVVKWYGTTEDIDDRRRAEEATRASERRVQIAQEAAGVLIWEWLTEKGVIHWGPGVERSYGRGADGLDYQTWLSLLHPEDRKSTLEAVERTMLEGERYEAEYRVVWPDGTIHWLVAKGEVFTDDGDKGPYLIGANIDITQRKQAEEALRESEARVREVLEQTTDAVFVLDWTWRFAYLNPNAVLSIAGGRDLLGKNVWEEFPDATERNFFREYHKAMRERVPVRFEEYYPEPLDKWFGVHAYPTREGIAVFFHDITANRRAEAALIQNEKLAAAGRLAASIAHEINNPLEAVTNLLYLLEGDSGLTEEGRQYLETAQSELARVSHTANQTLRFYRQSTRPTQTDIAEVLDSVIALYHLRHRLAGIAVERECRPSRSFLAFEGELRQVFANLLGNAADALVEGSGESRGGRIVLRSRPSVHRADGRPGVRVTVADNGHGMSQETRQRLFEPFFSTKGVVGTGLGLWVSKGLIEKHGGHMHVRSSVSEPHRGTTFSVFLPYAGTH